MTTHHEPSKGVVLSLFDRTGNMVRPWARAGYECIAVDIQADDTEEQVGDGIIYHVEADINEYLPPRTDFEIVFAFPPCTNLAVSGARWFEQKGIDGLADGLELVERAKRICKWSGAPWMLENPVSTISSYWREPDHTFHPYEFDPYTDEDETYRKKTCLWTGNGFQMPSPHPDAPDDGDDRVHKMPPSEDRGDERAKTPTGFAQAVFQTNPHEQMGNSLDYETKAATSPKNSISTTPDAGETKRDQVWIECLRHLQSSHQVRRADIADCVSASDPTVTDVLQSMRSANLVRHTENSPYWRRGPAFSRLVGHPTPTGGVQSD